MARSRKKHPWVCDRNPWMKNYANRRIRRIKTHIEIADGGSYRRYTCPWNICDRRSYLPYPYKPHWVYIYREMTEEEFRKDQAEWWRVIRK